MTVTRIVLESKGSRSIPYQCECEEGCGYVIDCDAYEALLKYAEDIGLEDYSIIPIECPNPRAGTIVAYADYYGAILASLYKV